MKKLVIIFMCFGLFFECKPSAKKEYGFREFFRNGWYGVQECTIPKETNVLIAEDKNGGYAIVEYKVKLSDDASNADSHEKIHTNLKKINTIKSLSENFDIYTGPAKVWSAHEKYSSCPMYVYRDPKVHKIDLQQYTALNSEKNNKLAPVSYECTIQENSNTTEETITKNSILFNEETIPLKKTIADISFTEKKPHCWERWVFRAAYLTAGVFFLNRFLKFRKNTVEV